MLHTWSLAVEEQFYLFFPLLLILLKHRSRPALTIIIAVLALVSLGLSVYGCHAFPSATFYFLPTRAWELLLGTLLALMRGRLAVSAQTQETTGWIGVILITYAIFFYDANTHFPGAGRHFLRAWEPHWSSFPVNQNFRWLGESSPSNRLPLSV